MTYFRPPPTETGKNTETGWCSRSQGYV
eukprot:SAG11_NODE_1737_length_4343_cov_2.762488_5_plen_27_part_01